MDTLNLIPQLFFDLIARVVPGSVALIMVAVVADSRLAKLVTDFKNATGIIQGAEIFLGLGFLLVAYLIGHILSPLSAWIEGGSPKGYFQLIIGFFGKLFRTEVITCP